MSYSKFFATYNSVEPPKSMAIQIDSPEFDAGVYDNLVEDLTEDLLWSFYPTSQKPLTKQLLTKQLTKQQVDMSFENAYEEAVKINPEVSKYRDFLVKTAKRESNFNSHILNQAGAPYYGYFLMGKEEIKRTTGLSVEEFRNSPIQQILGAVKLYLMNLKTLKTLKVGDLSVYSIGKNKGYSDDAMVSGAWLAGPGGVKRFLTDLGDPSDSHWYNGNGGTSVSKIMNGWMKA